MTSNSKNILHNTAGIPYGSRKFSTKNSTENKDNKVKSNIFLRYPKISIILLNGLFMGILGFTVRYLILHFHSLDILNVKENPTTAFISLCSFSSIKTSMKFILESYFFGKRIVPGYNLNPHLHMMGPGPEEVDEFNKISHINAMDRKPGQGSGPGQTGESSQQGGQGIYGPASGSGQGGRPSNQLTDPKDNRFQLPFPGPLPPIGPDGRRTLPGFNSGYRAPFLKPFTPEPDGFWKGPVPGPFPKNEYVPNVYYPGMMPETVAYRDDNFILTKSGKYIVLNPHNINSYLGPDGQPNRSDEAKQLAGRVAGALEYKSVNSTIRHDITIPKLGNHTNVWVKEFVEANDDAHRRQTFPQINSITIRERLKLFSEGKL